MTTQEADRRERQRSESLLADYYDEGEAAKQLRHSVRALRSWRAQGIGPAWIKIGKGVFYKLSALEVWLKSLEQKSARSRRRA
jgi:Helix-turn-helix domain